MGGGSNIVRMDSGIASARNPIHERNVEEHLMEALKVPVNAGDHAAAKKRFETVRKGLTALSPQQAGELLDQLNAKHPKDALAKEIKYRFSDSSVDELKKNLEMISGRWADKKFGFASTLGEKPLNGDGGTRKAEADIFGKLKRSNLDEIWNAYANADKIHHALSGAGIDEKAISEVLSGLSKKEKKQLQHVYQEKYGEDLYDAIRNDLSGLDLPKLK